MTKPIDKFNWCIRILRFQLRIIGMDIFQDEFRYSLKSHLVVLFYASVLFCYCYNIMFSDDKNIIYNSITFCCAFLVVRLKNNRVHSQVIHINYYKCNFQIFVVVISVKTCCPLVELSKFSAVVYENNSEIKSQYYIICNRYSSLCQMVLKIALISLLLMCLFMIIAPIIAFIITGKMSPSSGVYFPGITEYGPMTLGLLVIYNNAMIVGATSAEIPVVVLVYITFININMLSCMVIMDIKQLDNDLNTDSSNYAQLIRIIRMNEKYNA